MLSLSRTIAAAAASVSGGAAPARAMSALANFKAVNEPCLGFLPGSKERTDLEAALQTMTSTCEDIPIVIGEEEFRPEEAARFQVMPFDHQKKIAKYYWATPELIQKAIDNGTAVRHEWENSVPIEERINIFLRAAEMISGEWRAPVLASTMLGQSKTVQQAEIDAAAELIDFYRFNAQFAIEALKYKPIDTSESVNTMFLRGLEGFVAAIAPFNFTAIGGNLAGTPAMMGCSVLWKPSDTAMLSSWVVYKCLRAAGVPAGVINFVPADGPVFGKVTTSSPHLAGINFTGSAATFKHIWREVGNNIDNYRTFPRLVGECGGKNYHFVHPSANPESVINGTIRSAFEYSGQKCSACSRAYIPASLWEGIKEGLVETQKQLKIASPLEFDSFTSTVIDDKSFARISGYLNHAKTSPNLSVVAGGEADDSVGYYIQPTVVQTSDPRDKIMNEEIFGPVVSVFVYPDEQAHEMIDTVATTSPFALTGAVFSQDEDFVREASNRLRSTCGNFYINDKSTGSVVGQQPFGGARLSGTNDKAGGPHYVMKWCSPQAIKRTHVPLNQWAYANMAK